MLTGTENDCVCFADLKLSTYFKPLITSYIIGCSAVSSSFLLQQASTKGDSANLLAIGGWRDVLAMQGHDDSGTTSTSAHNPSGKNQYSHCYLYI